MKETKLFSLAITPLVDLASTAWAGPQGGGGGGHFGGGGFSGGHFSGFSAGHFGGVRVGNFNGGGIRAAPTFSGGATHFTGNRSVGGTSRAPQQFSYYTGPRASATATRTSARRFPS